MKITAHDTRPTLGLAAIVLGLMAMSLVVACRGGGGAAAGSSPTPEGIVAVGRMNEHRRLHSATLLPDGTVMVIGTEFRRYEPPLVATEVFDPVRREWRVAADMLKARKSLPMSLLPDGRIAVAGGQGVTAFLSSLEIYDPATGVWSEGARMSEARAFHAAVVLTDGRLLVVGGMVRTYRSSAEEYDPAADQWSSTGSMAQERSHHTATLLRDGTVLVAGGPQPG